ncbi:MAG: hypothetical protein M1115_00750 [Actinobacteria bacterium]|nr:hypothetical protein [Actinomycetota bacterium]
MSKPKKVFVSSEGKASDEGRWAFLLRAYGEVEGATVREAYVRWLVKGEKKQALRSELIKRGWKEDEADSILDVAQAAQDAAVESTTLALDNARQRLREVDKKLAWAMASNSKRRCRQRHGLARRRDRLASLVEHLDQRLKSGDIRVCFGSRKLARVGNDPAAHGYEDRDAWRSRWDRSRSNIIYLKGDKGSSLGNSCAKVLLSDGGMDLLRLRIPDLVTKAGVRLRDLSGGVEWVEIPIEGFSYGRAEIEDALAPAESASEARERWAYDREQWPAIGPMLTESKVLAEAVEHFTGRNPWWARGLPRKPPTTPYKASLASRSVSVRIVWREHKGAWYVVASAKPAEAQLAFGPSRALRHRFARVLGIDLNPDHVAWCVIDSEGNPLAWGRVDLDLTGSAEQNKDAIGRAAAEIARIAKHYGAPISHEILDFSRSRANLRYGCSARVARLLSSFAYNKFFATLASRCRREAIPRIPVNPAWTSVLGQANYAGVYGVSVDQGAACVIARRALGLRERPRPTLEALAKDAVARREPAVSSRARRAHPRSGAVGQVGGLRALAKALPKRRSTWEPSGLCLRRHSAQTPSGVPPEPHGVNLAADPGTVQASGSRPLHRLGFEDLSPSVKVVPCSDTVATAPLVLARQDGADTRLAHYDQLKE